MQDSNYENVNNMRECSILNKKGKHQRCRIVYIALETVTKVAEEMFESICINVS